MTHNLTPDDPKRLRLTLRTDSSRLGTDTFYVYGCQFDWERGLLFVAWDPFWPGLRVYTDFAALQESDEYGSVAAFDWMDV